ncbi:efflux RND transporter periplasmic adaptor subunit, partial [Myxococcota bacterium]|nr:efflux RND transporter periplasmic adaptor subunit [Myxococcota bacterium]
EWELLGRDKDDVKARLALRKPHLATSQSNLRSAESGVARAKLNLSRTALKAPFNSLVLKKSVDQGQLVSANTPVVTLIGTDVFWVDVMVPMEKLRFLDIPGLNAEQGSKATLLQKLPDGSFITRKGEILRLQGELDAATRQARLLVSIPSPLNNEGGALPLLPGAWVDVELHGKSMPESLGLPRTALREGSYVWTVTPSGTLEKRVVSIGWRGKEMLSISGGITAGDKVVTTLMSLPLEGMAVKATLGSTAHAEAAGSEQ